MPRQARDTHAHAYGVDQPNMRVRFAQANASSALATASDADLTALFKYAKHTHNLTVAFTPFLVG